jgi:hypothetical protein
MAIYFILIFAIVAEEALIRCYPILTVQRHFISTGPRVHRTPNLTAIPIGDLMFHRSRVFGNAGLHRPTPLICASKIFQTMDQLKLETGAARAASRHFNLTPLHKSKETHSDFTPVIDNKGFHRGSPLSR